MADPKPGAEHPNFVSSVDLEDPDEPASGGIQQGANHTRWEKDKVPGQGKKTHAAELAKLQRR